MEIIQTDPPFIADQRETHGGGQTQRIVLPVPVPAPTIAIKEGGRIGKGEA